MNKLFIGSLSSFAVFELTAVFACIGYVILKCIVCLGMLSVRRRGV